MIGGEFESERDDSVEKLPNFGMYEYDTAAHKFEYVCPTVPLSEQQGDLIGYRCCVLGQCTVYCVKLNLILTLLLMIFIAL